MKQSDSNSFYSKERLVLKNPNEIKEQWHANILYFKELLTHIKYTLGIRDLWLVLNQTHCAFSENISTSELVHSV